MEKGNPCTLSGDVDWHSRLAEQYWRFLKKTKRELPYDPAVLLLGIYKKKTKSLKNTNLKRYMHHNVHSSIIYNSQDMEAPKCPSTDDWFKKMCYIYI